MSFECLQLLLIDAFVRAEAPITGLPSETILVKIHTGVRRCGMQFARVIDTLAVSATDDRIVIRVRFIVAE
jgi:hypothetical protein